LSLAPWARSTHYGRLATRIKLPRPAILTRPARGGPGTGPRPGRVAGVL